MTTRTRSLLCILLGALAACGFAPLELWPLTLACLTGWLWLVHDATTLKAAAWRGWLFGVGHFTINNNWIQQAFEYQDNMPPVLGYGAVVGLALYLAVFPALAAGLAWRFGRRAQPDAAFALAFSAAWIASEWLRGILFTGYAWNPLSTIWVPVQSVAMMASLVGTYALSGLTVAFAGLALAAWHRRRWGVALLALPALAVPFSYRGAAATAAPDAPRLRIVQPGIGQDARGEEDSEPMLRALIGRSGMPGPAPRLILWPEGVVRDYVEDGYPWRYTFWQAPPADLRRRIANVLGPRDVLLFGGNALLFEGGKLSEATNSIYAIGPDDRLRGRYDKAHLVPYGEYLPIRWLLEPLGLSRLVPGDIDFRPGPGPRDMDLPGFGQIGMQICYEIIFSGEVLHGARRPRLLFNPSNDAWFGKWGPPQHLAQARMRAIEEGVPVVRATPTGISAAIGADGRILASVPAGPAGAVELPMPDAAPPTLFSRIGNWAAAATMLLLAVLAVALRRRGR